MDEDYTDEQADLDYTQHLEYDVQARTTEGMAFVRAGMDKFQLALDSHQGDTFVLRGLIAALNQSFSTFEENWCEYIYS
jgi:hypothetical protein